MFRARCLGLLLVPLIGLPACGPSSVTTPRAAATRPPSAAPTPTPDIHQAAAYLERAEVEMNTNLDDHISLFRAAIDNGDGRAAGQQAIGLLRAALALDENLNRLNAPSSAKADVEAALHANALFETLMESIDDAETSDEFQTLYDQIPGAQRAQQATLNQLCADLGAKRIAIKPIVAGSSI